MERKASFLFINLSFTKVLHPSSTTMLSFSTLLVTVATAITVRGAANTAGLSSTDAQALASISSQLNESNSFGAPIVPWDQNGTPGWYYGDAPDNVPDAFSDLPWLKDSVSFSRRFLVYKIADVSFLTVHLLAPQLTRCWLRVPHSSFPPKPSSFHRWLQPVVLQLHRCNPIARLHDLRTGRHCRWYVHSDYLSSSRQFSRRDVLACKDMCDSVTGCIFVNCSSYSLPRLLCLTFFDTAYHDVNGKVCFVQPLHGR